MDCDLWLMLGTRREDKRTGGRKRGLEGTERDRFY
jgi:hypothetical protein